MLALALQAIAIVAPFYMQWVVDGAVVSADRDLLTVLGLGFLLLAVVQVAVDGAALLGGAATWARP